MTMKAQQQEVTGGVEGASGLVVYFELDSWPIFTALLIVIKPVAGFLHPMRPA